MTIYELVQGARDRLMQAGISANNAALDAELLARQVLGWDKARFLTDRNEAASTTFLLGYEHFVARVDEQIGPLLQFPQSEGHGSTVVLRDDHDPERLAKSPFRRVDRDRDIR